MAIDTQTIAMTGSYVPYERPPQNLTLWSAIPRGLQSFLVPTGILDAKALNDSMLLSLTATLPPNFGYVMADLMVTIAQDEAADWNGIFILNLQNYYRAALADSVALSGTWAGTFIAQTDSLLRTTRADDLRGPLSPIIGAPGTSGALVTITLTNPGAAATTGGTVNASIAFWQFDLEQIRKYPINSPTPVHAR